MTPASRLAELEPALEDLSPDLRWQIVQTWKRRYCVNLALAATLTAAMLTPVLVPQVHEVTEKAIAAYLQLDRTHTAVQEFLAPDFTTSIQDGDTLVSYNVTSPFGIRQHPISGEWKQHDGVDLDTPIGTTLYMPGEGTVECQNDPTGYGLYALIHSTAGQFLAGHLAHCGSGRYQSGQVFAKTGNSGNSTGAHLHWEQIDADGKPIPPQKGYLIWALTGNKPEVLGFVKALSYTLREEGGYANHPADLGGATNYGVTQSTYDHYRQQQGFPTRPVAAITRSEVEAIYQRYWEQGQCGQYPPPLDVACFDSVINFGIEGGSSFLTNLPSDPQQAAIEVAKRRRQYRHQRVAERPDQVAFLQGWLNRDQRLEDYAKTQRTK